MSEISVTISGNATSSYPIIVDANLYKIATWFPNKHFSQIVVITDRVVKKHYGIRLQTELKKTGKNCFLFSFPSGEKSKNNNTIQAIVNKMQRQQCDKNICILALGGGVIGDIAGFIAAIYLRGVSYIQIPTTLLAMVDSSIGGKTGINLDSGKNLLGIIYQPIAVITDIACLKTLSKKNRINGLIEAIKMFLTHDAKSFYFTKENFQKIIRGDDVLLTEIITRAIKIKAGVVSRDEKEMGERSLLNFGHTIAHALETISNYKLPHGYAVGYGILVESTLSFLLGHLKAEQLLLIKNLFSHLGIIGKHLQKYKINQLMSATKNDKKIRQRKSYYVLLRKIGCAYTVHKDYVYPIEDKMVKLALKNVMGK